MAEQFRSKLDYFIVEANQITKSTVEAIAQWCGGLAVVEHDSIVHSMTFPAINVPTPLGIRRAQELWWVAKHPSGAFDALSPSQFEALFEPVE